MNTGKASIREKVNANLSNNKLTYKTKIIMRHPLVAIIIRNNGMTTNLLH